MLTNKHRRRRRAPQGAQRERRANPKPKCSAPNQKLAAKVLMCSAI